MFWKSVARRVFGGSVLRRPFSGSNFAPFHIQDPSNDQSVPFESSDENYEEIEKILQKYPSNQKKSATIPLLMLAQKQNDNFLSLAAMQKVAKVLNIPEIDVYETASFYTMFNRTRVGKFHLQVCCTTPCMLRGSYDILKVIIN